MKNLKRFTAILLSVIMLLATGVTAFAVDTGFTDVPIDAGYADAVAWCKENNIMEGTSSSNFSPDETLTRAMLVTVLYRAAGNPAAEGDTTFTDNISGTYYHDAVVWAASRSIVNGYGNGRFGSDDPVKREQLATILWRYDGEKAADDVSLSDSGEISGYAVSATAWAVSQGVMSARNNGSFAPRENATRAETASALYACFGKQEEPTQNQNESAQSGKVLVAYFSASGNTEAVAKIISNTLAADLFELTPTEPYTNEDLNWTDPDSRVNNEHENESLQDVELTSNTPAGWENYDTVFIGYPIWWGNAAWPVNRFITSNDFTGKTVIPFCTSTSSGLGQSGELLEDMANDGTWLEGHRFSERASQSDVKSWVNGLDLNTDVSAPATPSNSSADSSRALVVYFSMPETTSLENMTTEEDNSTVVIDGQVLGNTQYMAQVIQETVGADIFRIEPVTPYPTDHSTLVSQASEEQSADTRPAIKEAISNFDIYDTIFIGYPIWWSDMPQILYTFFDTYDFSGKTIIPFSTHGGSSFAGTPNTIQQLEPDAKMLDGLTISRNNIQDAHDQIVEWVNGLKK